MSCIFCKIINKEIPSKTVFENEHVLAFHDIRPNAPTHLLFIPKQHIERLDDISFENTEVIAQIYSAILQYADENNFRDAGFKTLVNVGAGGGQEVFHLHVHFLSKKKA